MELICCHVRNEPAKMGFFSVKPDHSSFFLIDFRYYIYIYQCACNEVARDGAVHIVLATLTLCTI